MNDHWDFTKTEKVGRCEFCGMDGSLTYIDALDQWLCFDCKTEFDDADEVMLLTGWITEEEENVS
jgi:hypothetical protein